MENCEIGSFASTLGTYEANCVSRSWSHRRERAGQAPQRMLRSI